MAEQIKKTSDSDDSGDFFHSAILAKHGISYNASDKNEKNTNGVCRDAADRLLDAMDKQLGDVLINVPSNGSSDGDPGTDLDSVRSLRNRMMSDLAETGTQKSSDVKSHTEPNIKHTGKDDQNYSKTPAYRSASTSRYGHSDDDKSGKLPKSTQRALASSLDRIHIPTERHQSTALSARNTSDSRKGRDYERSRDRRRLNDSTLSWETPQKLSVKDLKSPYSLRSKFYRSMDESRTRVQDNPTYYEPPSTLGSVITSDGHSSSKHGKFMNMTFDYHYSRPLSTRWHSTPMGLNNGGYLDTDEKHRNENFEKITKASKKLRNKIEDRKERSGKWSRDKLNRSMGSYIDDSSLNPYLRTPEKRDEYEWRMKKMIKEQEKSPDKIKDSGSKIDQNEKNEAAIYDEVGASSVLPVESVSLTEVYAKTNYHEVPQFASNDTTESKTDSVKSSNGEKEKFEKESTRSAEVSQPYENIAQDKIEILVEVPLSKISDDAKSNSSVETFGRKAHSSYNTSSSSCQTLTPLSLNDDLLINLKSTSLSSCATENLLEGHLQDKFENQTSSSSSTESVIQKNILSSESLASFQDVKMMQEDDVDSIKSDSTLTAEEKGSNLKSDSLETSGVPDALRRSLVRISSEDRSSLEFTLHVSSIDLESLPTSQFEANWMKRQKIRFPELDSVKLSSTTEDSESKIDPFSTLSPRSKRKLTKRERMKIALSASQKRIHGFKYNDNEFSTPRRRYSWGSDSLRSITTDDLLHAKSDGSNFNELYREVYKGGRASLPRSSSVASLSTVHTEEYEDRYKQMMVRHIAGVPVTSFDSVTIASDLDSVHTDAVREQFLDSMKKGRGHESSATSDSAKPLSIETNKSQRLRERYNHLKDQDKKHDGSENGINGTLSSTSPLKSSYRTSYTEPKIENDMQASGLSRTNDSSHANESILSQNGVLPSRCRTPSRQSTLSRHQSVETLSTQRPSSAKTSSRHSRAHSVGPTNRRERLPERDRQYYTNGHNDTRESIKPLSSRSSHHSDTVDSVSDHKKMTSNALNKLQELDSQIEEIESKKRTSEQDLKLMEKTIEGHRISLLKLEEKLRENQAKADDARTELMVLEFKKEQCRKEVNTANQDLGQIQDKIKENEDLGMTYDDVVSVIQERDDLRARFRRGEASRTTIAERQELERALHAAKDDLFRERKSTRERVEELEEKMEEINHNFEIMESEKNAEIVRLETVVQELKKNRTETENYQQKTDRADAIEAEKRNLFEKIEDLNKILRQKDKEIVSIATEMNRTREENRTLQDKNLEHQTKITEQIELREKLISETERNISAMRKDKEQAVATGQKEKENEIEKILQDIEKEKSQAVSEYKSERQSEISHLTSVIENKDKEIEQLRERLNHEDEAKRTLGEKLRMDAKEQVRSALAKERLAWDQEKQIADKRDDDLRRADFDKERSQFHSEVEEARNKCKIATEQIARLRSEIEELRAESRKLLQEKLDAVSQAREQERKDQNKNLDQLRAELEELNQAEIGKHRSKYGKLEEEFRKTKHEKSEAVMKCKEVSANSERSERCFTAEIHDECQKIADLIRSIRTPSQSRHRSAIASRSGSHISRSNRPANAEGAVSQLRALSDDVRATLRDLTTEVETHRRAAHIAQRERDMASSNGTRSKNSSSNHLSHQIAELNGHNADDMKVLSKQLVEKDNELRDIQRNMSMWKDTTAQKLAQKFEEELAVQLERKLGRHRIEHKRQIDRMEEELAHLSSSTNGRLGIMHLEYDAASSLVPPVNTSTPLKASIGNGATGDKGTVKLLRHLQGRVKQLRTENDLLRSSSQIMEYDGFRKSR